MNICMIMAPGPFGGAERVLVAGTKALAKQDCKITIVLMSENRNPQFSDIVSQQMPADVSVKIIPVNGRLDFKALRMLNKLLYAEPFNVVHTHGYKSLLYACLALAKKANATLVHTHHGVTAHTKTVKVYEWLERKLMRVVDRVIAVSDIMRDQLVNGGVREERIAVVENMVGIEPQKVDCVAHPPYRLLFVGRLSYEKGLDQLIAAVNTMPNLRNSKLVQFEILGDGPERERLTPLAPANFIFRGFVDFPSTYYANSHALIVPSRTEGMPMTVLEALSCGLPTIGFDVGGMSQIITDQKNGKLVPAGDCNELASSLMAFLDDPVALREGAMRLSDKVYSAYSPEAWATKTLSLYDA